MANERGECSIDPKYLVPTRPVEFGTVGVIDREAFERHFGKTDQELVFENSGIVDAGVERPAVEEILILAA